MTTGTLAPFDSSVAPGPLEDIVVPTAQPVKLVEEVLTQEMEEFLVLEIQSKKELPRDDICADKNIIPAAYSPEGTNTPVFFYCVLT